MFVFILQSNCCVSVVRDFNKLKKYNIHSIIEGSSQDEPEVPKLQEDSEQDSNEKTSSDSNVTGDTVSDTAASSTTGHNVQYSSASKDNDRDTTGEQAKTDPATTD